MPLLALLHGFTQTGRSWRRLAPLLAEGTNVIGVVAPDLTLDGLRLLAERNPTPTLARDRLRASESD